MKLLGPDTIWVFISGSDEERFVDDISFGIQCLLSRGHLLNKILVFIDQPLGPAFSSTYRLPTGLIVYATKELQQVLGDQNSSTLAVVVTGHGNHNGVAASPDIQPYNLLSIVKGLPSLGSALIVLGQCFAGTFNYLEARSTHPKTRKIIPPEVCIIGATDLNFSVSLPFDISQDSNLVQFACEKSWNANLFLFYFMLQLLKQIDIDGDGKHTVIDAYKVAGISTNGELLRGKVRAYIDIFQIIQRSTVSQLKQTSVAQQLAEKAREDIAKVSEVILINQNPWILNANFARQLEF